MPSQQNIDKVKEIKARFEDVGAAYFADYRGLTVPDIAEVRTALLKAEAQFAVLKNTLTRLAVRDLDLSDLEAFLEGPTAVAFIKGDIVVGAKALVDAAKDFPVLEVKGGLAEGRVLSADEIKELASLDTHEEMLAKMAGMLAAHMRKAAFLLQALQSKFVSLMQAYGEKLEQEAPAEEAPAAETEAPAAEQPEAEPVTEEPEPETPTVAPEGEPPAETPEEPAEETPAEEETATEQASAEEAEETEQEQEQDEQEQEEG